MGKSRANQNAQKKRTSSSSIHTGKMTVNSSSKKSTKKNKHNKNKITTASFVETSPSPIAESENTENHVIIQAEDIENITKEKEQSDSILTSGSEKIHIELPEQLDNNTALTSLPQADHLFVDNIHNIFSSASEIWKQKLSSIKSLSKEEHGSVPVTDHQKMVDSGSADGTFGVQATSEDQKCDESSTANKNKSISVYDVKGVSDPETVRINLIDTSTLASGSVSIPSDEKQSDTQSNAPVNSNKSEVIAPCLTSVDIPGASNPESIQIILNEPDIPQLNVDIKNDLNNSPVKEQEPFNKERSADYTESFDQLAENTSIPHNQSESSSIVNIPAACISEKDVKFVQEPECIQVLLHETEDQPDLKIKTTTSEVSHIVNIPDDNTGRNDQSSDTLSEDLNNKTLEPITAVIASKSETTDKTDLHEELAPCISETDVKDARGFECIQITLNEERDALPKTTAEKTSSLASSLNSEKSEKTDEAKEAPVAEANPAQNSSDILASTSIDIAHTGHDLEKEAVPEETSASLSEKNEGHECLKVDHAIPSSAKNDQLKDAEVYQAEHTIPLASENTISQSPDSAASDIPGNYLIAQKWSFITDPISYIEGVLNSDVSNIFISYRNLAFKWFVISLFYVNFLASKVNRNAFSIIRLTFSDSAYLIARITLIGLIIESLVSFISQLVLKKTGHQISYTEMISYMTATSVSVISAFVITGTFAIIIRPLGLLLLVASSVFGLYLKAIILGSFFEKEDKRLIFFLTALGGITALIAIGLLLVICPDIFEILHNTTIL